LTQQLPSFIQQRALASRIQSIASHHPQTSRRYVLQQTQQEVIRRQMSRGRGRCDFASRTATEADAITLELQ
jgi:hypothetical protein